MAGELPEYVGWVRKHPCCACGAERLVEAHHITNGLTCMPGERPPKALRGKRGKGQKAHDYYAIPMCLSCHRKLHDRSGPFREMSKQRLDAWQLEWVTTMQSRWDSPPGTEGDVHWLDTLPF